MQDIHYPYFYQKPKMSLLAIVYCKWTKCDWECMSLMSLINGRRDNTFHLSFKLAAQVCIFAHIAKIFVNFLLYFHHFSYLCTCKKKQPLKTGVHWTLRGTDYSKCLQQTDNQPSNQKGSIPSISTQKREQLRLCPFLCGNGVIEPFIINVSSV